MQEPRLTGCPQTALSPTPRVPLLGPDLEEGVSFSALPVAHIECSPSPQQLGGKLKKPSWREALVCGARACGRPQTSGRTQLPDAHHQARLAAMSSWVQWHVKCLSSGSLAMWCQWWSPSVWCYHLGSTDAGGGQRGASSATPTLTGCHRTFSQPQGENRTPDIVKCPRGWHRPS